MTPHVNVTVRTAGAAKLAQVAAVLVYSGDKGLQRELRRAASRMTKPLRAAARQGALQILPHRGGLDEHVASTARISTRVRLNSSKGFGLRIAGDSRDNLHRMDEQGIVRHPLFGNRKKWIDERIRPGWFTNPLILATNDIGPREIDKAIGDVADALQRKI
jgi:hypothetical protein